MQQTTIKALPKGEFFRRVRRAAAGIDEQGRPVYTMEPMQTVWVREYYCPSEKAYWCQRAEAVGDGRFFKGNTNVEVGFEY